MALIDGDEFVSGDILSYQQGNRLKDNWVQADPQANLGSPQQGMIVHDSDDERIYLRRASDYTTIWTPDAPFPWSNLFMNSGFGVWSQSDANKGIATLVYDNLAGGNFDVGDTITGATSGAVGKLMTDNGATSMDIGAVSGTFQDNEQIGNGAGVTADVDGDTDIGVKNDPMNNDSTGDWTDDGANITLAFAAAEYTVTTNAATQRAWIAAAALSAGHIYKIELDIKDGTAAGQDIEGYFNDGAAQYGKIKTTAAGWASVSWTFECATTTGAGLVGFRIPTSLGGSNIEIRRFSCYEIIPGRTAGDTLAFDEWIKYSSLDIYRQHNEATYTKDGSFYSLKMVPTEAIIDSYVRFPGAVYDKEEWYAQFQGRPVAFGAWVYTSKSTHCRLRIIDSVGNAQSDYHSGTPGWEWLEITRTVDAAAVNLAFFIYAEGAAETDGDSIIYISQPMLILGDAIGEGNYQPRLQEFIWTEKSMPSNKFFDETGLSSEAGTINVEADSDARIPKGIKSLYLQINAKDSGSSAAYCTLYLGQNGMLTISPQGLANDQTMRKSGRGSCDPNGDLAFDLDASAAGTWDFGNFQYHGIQVN